MVEEMIRSLRKRHFWIWIILAIGLAIGFFYAIPTNDQNVNMRLNDVQLQKNFQKMESRFQIKLT